MQSLILLPFVLILFYFYVKFLIRLVKWIIKILPFEITINVKKRDKNKPLWR